MAIVEVLAIGGSAGATGPSRRVIVESNEQSLLDDTAGRTVLNVFNRGPESVQLTSMDTGAPLGEALGTGGRWTLGGVDHGAIGVKLAEASSS
jgi:hypothetical protein